MLTCKVKQDDEPMLMSQVVGVSERRPERTAGVLPVMPARKGMMPKEGGNPETA